MFYLQTPPTGLLPGAILNPMGETAVYEMFKGVNWDYDPSWEPWERGRHHFLPSFEVFSKDLREVIQELEHKAQKDSGSVGLWTRGLYRLPATDGDVYSIVCGLIRNPDPTAFERCGHQEKMKVSLDYVQRNQPYSAERDWDLTWRPHASFGELVLAIPKFGFLRP